MILHHKDWNRFANAIVDTKTMNPDRWVRLASVYEQMGVRNAYWHLALLQPKLQGVDPHSDTLTHDQKMMIGLECKYNPLYFFREVVRLPNGSEPLRFRASRGSLALFWSFFNNIDFAYVIGRQQSKSVTVDVLYVWLICFGVVGTTLFIYTKDHGLRKKNIERIKRTIKLLPEWLNPSTVKELDNTEVVTMIARENIIRCAVGQASKDNALKTGRGDTLPIIAMDEIAFTDNSNISIPVLHAASTAARENAELANEYYGNIYTTTAGLKTSDNGKFAFKLIDDSYYWNESLFDAGDKYKAREIVTRGSRIGACRINCTLSHRQMGFTDEWLRQRIILTGGTVESINADFYNIWGEGNVSSPIPPPVSKIITENERDPLYTELTADLYTIKWYIPEADIAHHMATVHHSIGLDTSNLIGVDPSTLVFTDVRTLAVIATCSVSEANLHKYGTWVAELLLRFHNTTLIIENKSSAAGILDTIMIKLVSAGVDPFRRIYSRIVEQSVENPNAYAQINTSAVCTEDVYLQLKSQLGFSTNGSSRKFLYDTVLSDAVRSSGHLIADRTLSNEIRSLVVKNGRIDHPAGGHDDMVFSYMLSIYLIKYSKNLSHYGIPVDSCLSLVATDGATISAGDLERQENLIRIQGEVDDLKARLLRPISTTQQRMFEQLLANKVSEAASLGVTTMSLNSIMEEVKSKRNGEKSLRSAVNRFRARNW